MEPISILDVGSYLPGKPVELDFFADADADPLANSPLFRPPATRHHVAPDERAAEMVEQAARPMLERLAERGIDPAAGVDILITNVLLPDIPITGCGAEVAHRLDWNPEWIIDLHNAGCGSFVYMLKLVRSLMAGSGARTALLANVQNTAGQVFTQPELRDRPQSQVPGDGAAVAFVAVGDTAPVLAVETVNRPECAPDMGVSLPDGRKYWEPGTSPLNIWFDPDKTAETLARGNALVPEVVRRVCARIGVEPADVDVLITNQPNRIFLRNWRRALGVDPARHLDTFDRFGNLYGAGIPITLDQAVRSGRLRAGDLCVLAGFAHAGDFAAAAALRWGADVAGTDVAGRR